jgi:hypothetical protein
LGRIGYFATQQGPVLYRLMTILFVEEAGVSLFLQGLVLVAF